MLPFTESWDLKQKCNLWHEKVSFFFYVTSKKKEYVFKTIALSSEWFGKLHITSLARKNCYVSVHHLSWPNHHRKLSYYDLAVFFFHCSSCRLGHRGTFFKSMHEKKMSSIKIGQFETRKNFERPKWSPTCQYASLLTGVWSVALW